MLGKKFIDKCEYIDAVIFIGDSLYDKKDLEEFEAYLSRWVRETAKIKEALEEKP